MPLEFAIYHPTQVPRPIINATIVGSRITVDPDTFPREKYFPNDRMRIQATQFESFIVFESLFCVWGAKYPIHKVVGGFPL